MMIEELKYISSDVTRLAEYLMAVDSDFEVPLSSKTDLYIFTEKLLSKGHLLAVIEDNVIMGINGFYCNDQINKIAHFSILSCKQEIRGKGYARRLVEKMIEICKANTMKKIHCDSVNPIAICLYKSCGFIEYRTELCDELKKTYLELRLR